MNEKQLTFDRILIGGYILGFCYESSQIDTSNMPECHSLELYLLSLWEKTQFMLQAVMFKERNIDMGCTSCCFEYLWIQQLIN